MLVHIGRFRAPEHQPIHTMLAITIADLVIQMGAAWPGAVGGLFERFGANVEGYETLLDVLRMLPEENMNQKLMTDTDKRNANTEQLTQSTSQVVQFLTTLQCPSTLAKKKVLECFLSWIKFTTLQVNEIAQNPLLPQCFQIISEGSELSETATDIVIEVLQMTCQDLHMPTIRVVLPLIVGLRARFDSLLSRGVEAAIEQDPDGLQQICRVYVETGECLVPLIMEQITNPEMLGILQVILRCTDLPLERISSIPLEFWHRLADEVRRHPEQHVKIDQFSAIYVELLGVMIRRCSMSEYADPFQVDDDVVAYRSRLLGLAEDCMAILTPNATLEHVLKWLDEGKSQGVAVQEAHFFCLTAVGPRADVRDESVLWQLIQSLPLLIGQSVQEDNEAAMLHFTKKTAIELLGSLWKWVRSRPVLLRPALDMISGLLMVPTVTGAPENILERVKQVQQTASMAFKDICFGGADSLQDFVPNLTQLYIGTMALPIRMHLFVVEGVITVVANIKDDVPFRNGLEQLVTPLVTGVATERSNPVVVSEILDRLTTIIRQIRCPDQSTPKATSLGTMILNTIWPLIRDTLAAHPGDAKVVEKSCRVLKHSMRCVPDIFKPKVVEVASVLVPAFQQQQHSSYLYSAEILANTYASDPEVVPILTTLFHALSSTGLSFLMAAQDRLHEITELVEDYYGMFERYLRYAPAIVLEAPTLVPTLQLWQVAIFVQQKDAIEAIIAFIEAVLGLIAESNRGFAVEESNQGQLLKPMVLQIGAPFVEALFRLIASVPTRYVQEILPCVLEGIRDAFPQEFPGWLEVAFQHLPASVASAVERQKFGEQLVQGGESAIFEAVQDLCYRCEQVALRSRAPTVSA